MSTKKNQTLEHLKAIIQETYISSQQQIMELLQEKGISLPQSTISRALKTLRISKIAGRYTLTEHQPTPHILALQKTEESLIVAHTHPGSASFLAHFLDQHKEKLGILGTIAGDDTVLIITQNKQKCSHAYHELHRTLT